MSKEAMKLALEALEPLVRRAAPWGELDWLNGCKAISALREALAEPDFWEGYVPEPVKPAQCKYPKCSYPCTDLPDCRDAEQPAQQALDKKAENARELGLDYEPVCNKDPQGCWNVRCQLGKKCKNTPAQQEPVLQDIEQYRLQMAGISTAAIGYWKESDGIHPDYDTIALRDVAKLYAKYDELYRAQRTWVGLSPADRGKCLNAGDAHGWIGVMEATEARLKELNT